MANKTALILICGVAAAMLMFPPWQYTTNLPRGGGVARSPAGYTFVFEPPRPQKSSAYYGVELDWLRLVLQLGVVAMIAGGIFVFRRKD